MTLHALRAPYWLYITVTLYHIPQCLSIYRFLQIFKFYICHPLLFYPLKDVPHIPSSTTYGILRNYCSSPATSKLMQDRDQSNKTQCSAPYSPTKLTEGLSKIWRLPAATKIAVHVVIKPVMVYLSAKLVMQNIPVALSPGNVHKMALELPKLLCHLLQFMYFQIVLLLLENLAPFTRILSAPVMLI